MRHFNFNLQKVLGLRQYREQEAKIELGRAVSALTQIENRIKDTARTRHEAADRRFADIAALCTWDRYIIRLDREAERLAEEAARAELTVEEKRSSYLESSRELKVLEKLKEKRAKEYRGEMLAAETAELDDRRRK